MVLTTPRLFGFMVRSLSLSLFADQPINAHSIGRRLRKSQSQRDKRRGSRTLDTRNAFALRLPRAQLRFHLRCCSCLLHIYVGKTIGSIHSEHQRYPWPWPWPCPHTPHTSTQAHRCSEYAQLSVRSARWRALRISCASALKTPLTQPFHPSTQTAERRTADFSPASRRHTHIFNCRTLYTQRCTADFGSASTASRSTHRPSHSLAR